jgi:pimeloyl-ACP methyl ester carboxylesterase
MQFQYKYAFPFKEVHFDMEDGGSINGIHFEIPNALGVVYYLKGNSRSVKGWGKFAKDFVGKGYDFFMIDYRGFGKSKGKRSEARLYNDAQHVYKWLRKRYSEERIVVYGRSFGSGIAARVASWNHPKMLILDSPYYSFLKLVRRYGGFLLPLRWFLRYKMFTHQYLKGIECPVYILHGDKDWLIPYKHGVELSKINPENIKLLTIEGGRHNNLPEFKQFHEMLYDVLTESYEIKGDKIS